VNAIRQVFDGADNAVYDIFAATDEEFFLIFPVIVPVVSALLFSRHFNRFSKLHPSARCFHFLRWNRCTPTGFPAAYSINSICWVS
jgi:hypothetical protein